MSLNNTDDPFRRIRANGLSTAHVAAVSTAEIDYILWMTARTEEIRLPEELFHKLYLSLRNALALMESEKITHVLTNMELCVLDAQGGSALYDWSADFVAHCANLSAAFSLDDPEAFTGDVSAIAEGLKLDFDWIAAHNGCDPYHDIIRERRKVVKRIMRDYEDGDDRLNDYHLTLRLRRARGEDLTLPSTPDIWDVPCDVRSSGDFAPHPSFLERILDVMEPGAFEPPPTFVRAKRKKPALLPQQRRPAGCLPSLRGWVIEKSKIVSRKVTMYLGMARGFLKKEAAAKVASDDREIARARLQSGAIHAAAASKRAQRDEQRRAAKKAADEARRKKIPKRVREQAIKDQRDKRTPSLQSGAAVKLFMAAVGGVLLTKTTKFLDKATDSVTVIGELMSMLKETCKKLSKHLGPLLAKIPLVMLLWWFLHMADVPSVVIRASLITAVTTFVGPSLWACISEFFPEGNAKSFSLGTQAAAPRLQSGFDAVVEMAPKLASTCFTFSALKSTKPAAVGEFCKRISCIERMASGFESFLDWVLRALEVMINTGMSLFSEKRVSLVRQHHKKMYAWAAAVDEECKKDNVGQSVSQDALDRMIKLVIEGYAFKQMYIGSNMARVVDAYHSKIVTCLMPYQGAISSRNNNRFEPSMLMLYGAPGIGKSVLSMPLCSAIMIHAGLVSADPDDIKKNIWQKGTSEYWNGYAGQICLVMDDAFQKRSVAGEEESEYMQIIRMVSSWSFPLNFADLASKGKIYFGSKFIYGSTNLKSIKSEAAVVIQKPEAVARRINFPYQLHLKPEFSHNGMLDIEKYQQELKSCADKSGLDAYPWYIWEVSRHDFLENGPEAARRPLVSLVEEIVADLKAKGSAHIKAAENFDNLVTAFAKPKEDAAPAPAVLQGGYASRIQRAVVPDPTGPFKEDENDPIYRIIAGSRRGVVAASKFTWSAVGRVPQWFADEIERFEQDISHNGLNWSAFSRLIPVGIAAVVIGNVVRHVIGGFFHLLWNMAGARNFRKRSKAARRRERLSASFWHHETDVAEKKSSQPLPSSNLESNRPVTLRVRNGEALKHVSLQAGDPQIASNIYANGYKVYVDRNDGAKMMLGTMTMIEGEMGVQPAHFTESVRESLTLGAISETSLVHFQNCMHNKFEYTRTVSAYLALKRVTYTDRDVEFVHFSDTRAHRNIRGSFMTEKDIRSIPGYRLRLDICDVNFKAPAENRLSRRIMITPAARQLDHVLTIQKDVRNVFAYPSETMSGDCGAPLCIVDNTSFKGHAFCGFHIAGSGGPSTGYAAIITREMVAEALSKLDVIEDRFEEDAERRGISLESSFISPHDVPNNSSLPIFTVDRPIYLPRDTKFYRTELFGEWGEYTDKPAILRPTVIGDKLVYPMERAVANYFSPVLMYEQEWLPQAVHVAMKPFTAMSSYFPRRILTFEESVVGVSQEKLRAIPRGTSPGFPYVYNTVNGKKQFFGDEGDYDLSTPLAKELRERDAFIIEQAKNNRRLAHVFLDFGKDELRPQEKVEACETRLISSAPLDYTVSWRRYFSSFSTAVMRLHTRIGMCPGICTYSDWGTAAEMLERMGPLVFDGDFKRFDASEQPTIMRHILDFINRWYDDGEENARVRRVLWLDLIHSRHIGGRGDDQRHIYQWNKSLPSGHPFTTIVNSMYSLIMLVGAYISITGDTTNFWEVVSALVYGDDNVVNVDRRISHLYNQSTVSAALWKEFGMVYTAGSKTAELTECTTIDRVTFLKRSFRKERNVWMCPLQLESFVYIPYWCKNRKLEKKICLDVLEANLEELSLHEQQVWDTWAPRIFKAMRDRDHVPRCLPDRQAYQNIVLKRTENWY